MSSELLSSRCWTHDLDGHLVGSRTGCEELLGHGGPLRSAAAGQDGLPSVLVYHHGRAGVDVGPVQDRLAKLLHVPGSDGLRVGQFGGKHLGGTERTSASPCCPVLVPGLIWTYQGESYLVGPDVHVRADDGPGGVVHPFSHHVFAEQSLLLLQNLPQRKTSDEA